PRLPPELERAIFEISALSHLPGIPTLMRVAWRVKEWVEPLMYRVVMVSGASPRKMLGFPIFREYILPLVVENKPSEFFQDNVKHLFLESAPDQAATEALLTACSHIISLVLLMRDPSPYMSLLASMRCLQRLSVEVEALFPGRDIDFIHPLFRNVTHLEIFHHFQPSQMAEFYPGLALVPNLTHVAFHSGF
ncbi:hypothetical protein B0H16DRAFT_1242621, partial [Mycena metata]